MGDAPTCRCRGAPHPGLLAGIALFNAGEFFECHEVLEALWRAESDPVRALYQGILQIGVAFHHLGRGNWRGATSLLRAGIEKVSRFRPSCMGVDTAALVRQSQRCQERLQALGPERIAAFDWSLVPTVTVRR
ncbi:MAG: DUF309 domain-containing protein [Sphaerobacter sp.]|nr:DUF309 domain-containing protein [Sphaerobacter sp.]